MATDSEERMALAIAAVQNGTSQRAAARIYGVSKATLAYRLHGGKSRREVNKTKQLLSPDLEDYLVKVILDLKKAGRTPHRWEVKQIASRMLQKQGLPEEIGKHWMSRFLRRYLELKTKPQAPLETSRAAEDLPDRINRFFDRFKALRQKHHFQACHIANMDEHGLQEGESSKNKVVGTALTKVGPRQHSETTNWVSILETITADGRALTPAVIFQGEHLQGQWFEEHFPNWKYATTSTGWSNNFIALGWLKEVYLQETKPLDPRQWRLLIIDNHNTYIDGHFQYEAKANKVELLYLPSHSSHVTQPADLGVYSALKTYFRTELAPFAHMAISAPYSKRRFLQCYEIARQKALTDQNIKSGFKKAGIWPPDRRQPLNHVKIVRKQNRPTTPEPPLQPGPSIPNEVIWNTPKGSQDLKNQVLDLEQKYERISRTEKALFKKAGKAVDLLASQLAIAEQENKALKDQIKALQPISRKRVKKDPTQPFYEAEDIEQARISAERRSQRWQRDHAVDIAEQSKKTANRAMEDMMFTFDLADSQ
jgi:4-hydroxybenzoate polyprenyltransferase